MGKLVRSSNRKLQHRHEARLYPKGVYAFYTSETRRSNGKGKHSKMVLKPVQVINTGDGFWDIRDQRHSSSECEPTTAMVENWSHHLCTLKNDNSTRSHNGLRNWKLACMGQDTKFKPVTHAYPPLPELDPPLETEYTNKRVVVEAKEQEEKVKNSRHRQIAVATEHEICNYGDYWCIKHKILDSGNLIHKPGCSY